jgi:hypothetical protein
MSEFFIEVDYKAVIPNAASRDEACRIAKQILNIPEDVEVALFGFRVELDK